MPLIDRDPTPAQQAASRANGRHSAGPTTPDGKRRSSLNALKHGCYSESLLDTMLPLGEDPAGFTELRQGLLDAHQPANAAEALLVDDLALLRWRRIRNERAQAGVLGRARERLELEHQRRVKELNHELNSAPRAEILEHGFFKLPDSPGKYEKICSLLDSLLEQVRDCHFSLDADPVMTMLWGQEPSLRGVYFGNAFRQLKEATADLPEGGRVERWPEDHPSPDAPPDSGHSRAGGNPTAADPSLDTTHSRESGNPEADKRHADIRNNPVTREAFRYRLSDPDLEYLRLDLMRDLLDERRLVDDAYQHFLKLYVTVTPSQWNACLAPNDEEWHALRLQEAALDRQIERKTRLLMEMRREARRAEKWEWKREEREAERERQARGADGGVNGPGGGPGRANGSAGPNGRGSPPEPDWVMSPAIEPESSVAGVEPEAAKEAAKETDAFSRKRTRQVDENTGSASGEGSDASLESEAGTAAETPETFAAGPRGSESALQGG